MKIVKVERTIEPDEYGHIHSLYTTDRGERIPFTYNGDDSDTVRLLEKNSSEDWCTLEEAEYDSTEWFDVNEAEWKD